MIALTIVVAVMASLCAPICFDDPHQPHQSCAKMLTAIVALLGLTMTTLMVGYLARPTLAFLPEIALASLEPPPELLPS